MLAAFTLLTISCGIPMETTDVTTSETIPRKTAAISEYKHPDVDDYYVAIGYDSSINRIWFIHFTGSSCDDCWWIQDKEQYCVGDIYTLSEEHKTQAESRKHIDGPWEKDNYGSYAKFEKIGNCKDLMTIKTLEVTYAEVDEIEGTMFLIDTEPVFEGESGTYTYKYATFGTY